MANRTAERLSNIVSRESMLWGNTAEPYHSSAAADMDAQWIQIIGPIFARNGFDLSETIDFACGYGRNARKLKEAGAKRVTLVDVNQENLDKCNATLVPLGGYETFLNNGIDLDGLPSNEFTHIYSFDAMVHFDLELVISYIGEFARVLKPGGTAFIHHSNFPQKPGASFLENPHMRNFMSADIFRHVAVLRGFDVLEQNLIDWGASPQLDCITVMRKVAS